MSGFSAEWLALRETVDHRAISAELHAAIRGRFASCERVAIVDMGCGTGSNLRALTGDLPKRQTWRLVDHDPELLSAARETLSRWADTHEAAGSASPWRLAEDDRPLIKMLAAGIANAARETGLVDVRTCEDWAASRAAASSCEIGHADLWGFPKTD